MRLCTILSGGKPAVGVKMGDGKIVDLSKQMPKGPKSVVEILAGVLTGAQFGQNAGVVNGKEGHFFLALNPDSFMPRAEFTSRLVEGYFQLKVIGPTKVKGVTEPVEVYEVTGLGPLRTRLQRSAARGYTKFVGREREIEALHHAAEQARAGCGQIVAVVAEQHDAAECGDRRPAFGTPALGDRQPPVGR